MGYMLSAWAVAALPDSNSGDKCDDIVMVLIANVALWQASAR